VHRHWQRLIRPLFDRVRPSVIVEVGSRGGLNTRHLLEYGRDHGAHVHVIDPEPIGNREEIADLLAAAGTVHRAISLDALPGLAADAVLIDGDHNWYTVFHELRTIQATARLTARWPICLLHDVGWPYGRRDSYYVPERIPPEHRQPFARRGLAPGRSDLLLAGGFNRQLANALEEGGPKNGVLTAVEDFIAASSEPWKLAISPPFHGLGVLYLPPRMSADQAEGVAGIAALSPEERDCQEAIEAARLERLLETAAEQGR
jgi:hypothetical protein